MRTLGRCQLTRYGLSGTSETDHFGQELEDHIGVDHALAVNSGTSALVCALAGLGVGPGDEILVPAYTWVSSAAAAAVVGAIPILVEIDRSLTMDPNDLEAKITDRSRVVIPVHMLNLPAEIARILAVERAHDLLVVADACQAIGVTYKGRMLGSIGDAGAFNFNQHKNIRCGEGGALLTSDERTCVRAAMFHDVGAFTRSRKVEYEELPFAGMNLRMPEQSSALLRPQLRRLGRQMAKRAERRAMILDKISSRSDLVLSPHNDEQLPSSSASGSTTPMTPPGSQTIEA